MYIRSASCARERPSQNEWFRCVWPAPLPVTMEVLLTANMVLLLLPTPTTMLLLLMPLLLLLLLPLRRWPAIQARLCSAGGFKRKSGVPTCR